MESRKAFYLLIFYLFFFSSTSLYSQVEPEETFTNPLLPSGADPWVTYKDGYYYYTHTQGNRLTIWKTKDITDLKSADSKTVWKAPETGLNSKNIWAPEIHFLNGKWYIYYAADDGNNANHRMWVLENSAEDPLTGTWIDRGKLNLPEDEWAIDATIFENKGKLYVVWSGWEGNENISQDLYIASLRNPYTPDSERVMISQPDNEWEKTTFTRSDGTPGPVVNEGPVVLKRDGKLFLVYSANHCSTDVYALGMLIASEEDDLLKPETWKKHPNPVFEYSSKNEVFAPGHNSFFQSPDGTEDWILYHANAEPGLGCGRFRSPRAQPFTWNDDGTPNFGTPVPADKRIQKPSGL